MLRLDVVPNQQITLTPRVFVYMLRFDDMSAQASDKRVARGWVAFQNAFGGAVIDIQNLAAGPWMCDDHWVDGGLDSAFLRIVQRLQPLSARFAHGHDLVVNRLV